MDELELLKKDWKNRDQNFPKLSYEELYKMHLKKSSSIVKWIFVISILEFVLWTSLDIITRSNVEYNNYKDMGLKNFSIYTSVIYYGVLIYFIIVFYLNYKKIQVTDSAKILMQNIIKTRKAVKQYVWANIILFTVMVMVIVTAMLLYSPEIRDSDSASKLLFIGLFILLTAAFIGIIALFYRLVYGFLTRRLKENYKELEKIDL